MSSAESISSVEDLDGMEVLEPTDASEPLESSSKSQGNDELNDPAPMEMELEIETIDVTSDTVLEQNSLNDFTKNGSFDTNNDNERDNERDESVEMEDFEFDSDMYSSLSDDQEFDEIDEYGINISHLDELLNEGLPEHLRKPARGLKKTKEEIVSLLLRRQTESKEDGEIVDDGQISASEEVINKNNREQQQEQSEDMESTQKSQEREAPNVKAIVALDEKGKNPLEILPHGWIEVRHTSGMPLYLHRATRVCTWAKPYELRTGSARKHSIPLSSIPCLAYTKALERERDKHNPTKTTSAQPAEKDCDISGETGEATGQSQTGGESGSALNQESAMGSSVLAPDDISSSGQTDPSNLAATLTTPGSVSQDSNSGGSVASPVVRKSYNASISNALGKKFHLGTALRLNKATPETMKKDFPNTRVETAGEKNTTNSVEPIDFRCYCEKLFKFKQLNCTRFKTWSARRKHHKEVKRLNLQRPALPDGVKLITFSVKNSGVDAEGGKNIKDYILNPHGKSSVCILHEYVQYVHRIQPTYIFEELENAATPYRATVQINGVAYADGEGSSKKQAKAVAAKATLELVIPELKEKANVSIDDKTADSTDHSHFFDQVPLDDPRITKMCASISEPSPYTLLLTCLQRNFGRCESTDIKFSMISSGNQSNKFRMETREYAVEVVAANKREGKQLASQALLAKIHPQIKDFNAFLVLYGNGSIKSVKEKKQEEQQITTLQSKASANSPNYAILAKLKEEMLKLRDAEKLLENGKKNSTEGCPKPPQENLPPKA